MSAAAGTEPDPEDAPDERYSVDELAAATGLTVRTTRYYAGLGLLPPPERRGRMASYGPVHRARLELIRSLQEHGYTLSAISAYLTRLPMEATAEELRIQRVMLTGWQSPPAETVTRRELDRRVGRPLSEEAVRLMVESGAISEDGDRYALLASFDLIRQMLALDLPLESMTEANEAISRHMSELADELTGVLRNRVLVPFRATAHSEEDTARFEETMTRLREITMEAVVLGFQRAANQVIDRSLTKE